jgi:hypothetical protein
MATKLPLVLGPNGKPQQLQSGDDINVPFTGTNTIQRLNGETGSISKGRVCYISAGNTMRLAQANALATSNVEALVYAASIANGASGQFATDGLLTATTGEWDAITGQTGGLTPGATYFLSAATAGGLTVTAPTTQGQCVVQIGTAHSATDLMIDIETEVLL